MCWQCFATLALFMFQTYRNIVSPDRIVYINSLCILSCLISTVSSTLDSMSTTTSKLDGHCICVEMVYDVVNICSRLWWGTRVTVRLWLQLYIYIYTWQERHSNGAAPCNRNIEGFATKQQLVVECHAHKIIENIVKTYAYHKRLQRHIMDVKQVELWSTSC